MSTVRYEEATRIYPGTNRPAVDALDLDIAMVFQNYALYPHMTVYDNVSFALKLRKTRKADIDKRVRQDATLLQLDDFLGRKPKALSGGQRQRVAMGRAIVRHPKVFLMDVAGFIGSPSMNIKTVPLTDEGAAFAQTLLPLTRDQVEAARADGTGHVTVGFRPENTDLVGPEDGGVPIHVDLVEELGSDAYVYGVVALEGQDGRFVVRVDSRQAPALGEIVHVKPRVGAHHAFHAVTGLRL